MSNEDIQSISYRVNQWLYTHPDATKIPHYIEALLKAEQKHIEAEKNKRPEPTPFAIATKDELEESLASHSERKLAELRLADYIDGIFAPESLKLDQVVKRLRHCRSKGVIGKTRDGGQVHVWDEKCSCSKLCPHESREETRRLINRYKPNIVKFCNSDSRNRAYYSVFSVSNYAPGQLQKGKKEIFERIKRHVLGNQPYCRVFFADGPACEVKTLKANMKIKNPDKRRPIDLIVPGVYYGETDEKLFPNIKGALLVQEDPLSAHDDWNIHLNVVLLTTGAFSYREVRAAWFDEYQLYFNLLDKYNLDKALKECIKYSAAIVPGKSIEKAKNKTSPAPAMIEWPHDRWIEWYTASKGFRRTRSTGVLYDCKDEGTDKDLTDVMWEGEINFSHEGRYLVSLIKGDKSGKFYQRISDMFDHPRNNLDYERPP